MKRISLFVISSFVLMLLIASCHKKCVPSPDEETNNVAVEESLEEITYIQTFRDDIPPPPIYPWTTLDTTNLDLCQSRLWEYLKTMYPTEEENYWNYNIYSIQNEPDEIYANRAFFSQHIHFFGDTIWSNGGLMGDITEPCKNIDSTFFLQAVGPPTMKSYAGDYKVTYFYFFKLKYRRGPCAYIFDKGNDFEHFGNIDHFIHCSAMRVSFLQESGRMVYIDFM